MAAVIFTFGDDVSTDVMYPGRYMATVLPAETPQFAFADIAELNTKLRLGQVAPGSVLVAGENFGCGSSREQAVSTLKGYDLVIVARSYARIFLQNSINLGLRLVTAPGITANVGDELNLSGGEVVNQTLNVRFPAVELPAARQAIIDAGGLIPYTRTLLLDRAGSVQPG